MKALDELDELDRRIIVALQRDGRASWTAIAETVKSSVATVARRGQQLIADGIVRVAIVPAQGSTGQADSFLIRIHCKPGTQLTVLQALVAHEDVRFVTLVTGPFDILAELVVRGGATHYPQLIQQLQSIEGIERWRGDLVLHVYKVSHDWGRQVFADMRELPEQQPDPLLQIDSEPCNPQHFDRADWEILTALQDDGRSTFQTVADSLGMNESSVRRRFEKLRTSGCIEIFTLVPAPALGLCAETLLIVKVEPIRLKAVARELSQYPAVRYVAATLDENSLVCEVISASTADLYDFITSTLSVLDGVQSWSAAMELLSSKRGFVETPWWRAQVALNA
ncbi:Lrp/AsnC family transcriptional regulator [Arthrobacter sp. KNU-44]|uniref:Lrp/AsnC family transcriptional regulator n=1 Tax=Arthrobacter sp. KNU-44 TaxID=3450744 RepID=UPI003F42D4AD